MILQRDFKTTTMVLQELGGKLTSALRRLQTESVVDKETIKAVVGDICRALLESDVNVQMVMKLRKNVEAKAKDLAVEGASAGAAQRRSIQKAVMDELIGMLDPKTVPYKMKKGKSNVIMFVGLQVKSPRDGVRREVALPRNLLQSPFRTKFSSHLTGCLL